MVQLTLTPSELAFLLRCVQRDLEDFEEAGWRGDADTETMLEAAQGEMLMRTLRRVEQEQILTH
jgi:hypothetical protein